MKNQHLVFVYGSLKEGFGNHPCLGDAIKVADAITLHAEYSMHSMGGFPGVYRTGVNAIWGEIYALTDKDLARCDALEGHPSFYRREKVEFVTPEGEIITAWIYLLPKKDVFSYALARSGYTDRIDAMNIDGITVLNWLPRQYQQAI